MNNEITIDELAQWYCEYQGLEVWKDIPGLPGYQAGAVCGHVRSLDYHRSGKTQILSESPDSKGYPKVKIRNNGKNYVKKVHKLVAETFIQNPLNLPQVNHKDENKNNNSVFNLEYCDMWYNIHYGTGIERSRNTRIHRKIGCKPVLQYSLNGDFIAEYPSVEEAKIQTNTTHICDACSGKRKYAGGYIWKYKSEV